jgi:cation diffusion facilitator CzcD-associated flavoprotein CzcO
MSRSPSVLIVGAGFGGLAAAIELTRNGYRDVTILEKADGIGGVWRDNTYPGAACDAPSDLYSFSYAPNPRWPKRFAEQPDILGYLHDVARRFKVADRIRFGVEIAAADFDDTMGIWRLTATDGRVFEADVFVPALGQLSRPVVPAIAGARTFRGPQFHSARWDHGVELAGTRVAVIGTGASAIQIVPAIAPEVAQLTVFQRSAPWIVPKLERAYLPPRLGPLGRPLPLVPRAERLWWFGFYETITHGLDGNGPIADVVTAWANRHRARQIADPELLAKATPDYQAGCKRGLMSNDYYPALMRPNVRLETTPIRKIAARAVVTDDGVRHDADVLVYCTGFAATDFLAPLRIRGLGGKELAEEWATGARAYLGMTVPHFPNMFLMYGPNTNLGAGSIVYMHEKQARYIRAAVDHLRRTRAAYVAVRPEVEERYDAEIQQRLSHTVWTRCTSWYRDANGRVATNWPGTMREYDQRTKRFDADAYDVVSLR